MGLTISALSSEERCGDLLGEVAGGGHRLCDMSRDLERVRLGEILVVS